MACIKEKGSTYNVRLYSVFICFIMNTIYISAVCLSAIVVCIMTSITIVVYVCDF
jgi:hypothetical protein